MMAIHDNIFEYCTAAEFADKLQSLKMRCQGESWRVIMRTADEIEQQFPNAVLLATGYGSIVGIGMTGEIFGLMHDPKDTVRGHELVAEAIRRGGNRLDAFSGNFHFWTSVGFEPVSWCMWDDTLAPKEWNGKRDAREPVVFYLYTGKTDIYKSFEDFVGTIPASCDYEEAYQKREAYLLWSNIKENKL